MKAIARGSIRFTASVLVLGLAFAVAPGNAAADVTWGPRAGFSIDPDQFVLGAHVQVPAGSSLYFVPSLDLAFGDNLFTIGLHGDMQYRFKSEASARPYLGAGFSYYSFDPDSEGADSNSEAGLSILGGVWLNATGSTPFFLEGKFYVTDDMPDFKIMAGLNL